MNFLIRNRIYAFLALLIIVPLIVDPLYLHLSIRSVVYSIVVMGFTLFVGFTGQISLGHAAFFGLGAYLSGILNKPGVITDEGVPFLLSILIATLIVGLIGFVVGISVLHTQGHYLALASIAVAMIIYVLVKNADITGGPSGLIGIPKPEIFGFTFSEGYSFYYLALTCAIIGYLILHRLIHSRTGDALRAIANNELAAQSLGIPVFRYKVLSFTVSVLFAAFAGALFGHYDGFIGPEQMNINVSILFLTMAFVGGIGNLRGAIIGAISLTFLEEFAKVLGDYHVLAYGLLLAIIILYLPKGLVDLPNQTLLRFRR